MAKNQIQEKLKLDNLRVRVRHNSGDITKRSPAILRTELRDTNENNLQRTDIRNVNLSLYRERLRPKYRDETHTSITKIDTMTSKLENFVIVNDQDSGIVIFSTASNAACLCNNVEDLFIDGTFKCCPHYFYQLYTIHGGKNGNYVPLVFVILPAKTEICCQMMWTFITDYCTEKNLVLAPKTIHIDFDTFIHFSSEWDLIYPAQNPSSTSLW